MSEKNKETVRKVNDSFLKGDFEGFFDYSADDVQWTIVGEVTNKGKDNIRKWMKSMAGENPEPPKVTVTDPGFGEGDFVATRGEMTMKDPKTGKTGDYSYCDIYRFRDGKIVELNSYVVKIEAKGKSTGAA